MVFNVSTSEVATFLTCRQRWMYAHHPSYNLEPRTLGLALTRGLIGHEALEIYYKAISHGRLEMDAREASQSFIMKQSLKAIQLGDGEKAKMVSTLGVTLMEYYESEQNQKLLKDYNILGVEYLVTTPLPGTVDINFAGRIDLALETAKGPHRGEVSPFDHKFTYNFWPDLAIAMNAQISNYIWSLRELGYRSRNGYLNFIRYREDAVEKFMHAPIETNSTMRDAFINNHFEAAKQIVDLKLEPKVGLKDGVTRSTSKFNCEYCPFVMLCMTEAKGLDSTLMVKASYRRNSYGYDSELDVA
ncbi:PD-(D/E)XK nuclease family protein [Streptomyces anandii]|uniref:PD-(D/E)XK nuclease family protein n=1 Tax=Streptomyces anandii TaxID=285454 RepID=UPI0036C9F300